MQWRRWCLPSSPSPPSPSAHVRLPPDRGVGCARERRRQSGRPGGHATACSSHRRRARHWRGTGAGRFDHAGDDSQSSCGSRCTRHQRGGGLSRRDRHRCEWRRHVARRRWAPLSSVRVLPPVSSSLFRGVGVGSRSRLALAGIAVSAALASLTQAVLAANQFAFNEFRYWASGSLEGVDMASVASAGTVIAGGAVVSPVHHLGTGGPCPWRRRRCEPRSARATHPCAWGCRCDGTGRGSDCSGRAPHVRRPRGAAHGSARCWSPAGGYCPLVYRWSVPAWVCGADVVSRLVLAPSEVPVGVIVALIGAPFFILGARGKGMS